MAEKVKSFHCEVCGAQRQFTKSKSTAGKGMMGKAYDQSNPLLAASGGVLKAGGAALTAARSYRCVVCGSKKGTSAEDRSSA